jgi:Uma2 family endonuclease
MEEIEGITIKFISNSLGNIVALGIPEDVYMRDYAAHFCEWKDGTVVKFPMITSQHNQLTMYLTILLDAYLELRPIGEIRRAAFVMRLSQQKACLEPDIQVILADNQHNLKDTYMDGVANIVIEVVSPESAARDYGEKFHEYEQAGVPEYWIIDPIKEECRFYLLNAKKTYMPQEFEDEYSVAQMPGLKIHVPILWQENPPGPGAISKQLRQC